MSLIIGSHYDFTTQVPGILGRGYNNAKLLAILTFDLAITYSADLVNRHAQVYPQLSAGTPVSARDLTYYLIQPMAAERRIVAHQWLTTDPTPTQISKATVVIEEITPNGLSLLQGLLQANGFYKYTISAE